MPTLRIQAHCTDLFNATLSEDGKEDREVDGYVPTGLGIGGGDDVVLKIDTDTGQIIGWKPLTRDQLEEVFGESSEEG